jgi:uncharacterized BrkB/YihY/UPF0761 family membrane protein
LPQPVERALPESRAPAIPSLHRARAYCKIVGVAMVLGLALGALAAFVSRENVNDLRHHLTLWLVIAIVAIINIVSFLMFTLFWLIYRWIKRDLDPRDDD